MLSAKKSINDKVKKGKPFEVKDLFEGYIWTELSKGERIMFGKYFANEVREGRVDNIQPYQKGKDNHRKYIKI